MNTETILAILGFGIPGGVEWVVILLGALLIFGRRLPDVARSIGRSIVEFKKGVRDIRDEVDLESQPNRLDRQTPAGISQEPTKEPTIAANEADTTPVAPASSSAADTPPPPTTEPHKAPVAPSSPTPQSNDS